MTMASEGSVAFSSRLQKYINHLGPLEVVFNNTFDNTLRIINDLVEDPKASDEQLIGQIKQLHDGVKATAAYHERYQHSITILNQLLAEVKQDGKLLEGDYDPVAEYQRRYAQAVKDLERDNMDNHEKVKESEASCWDILHPDMQRPGQEDDEDADLVMDEVRETYKCPLTQQSYVRPVTNTVCHHSYSKEAIEQHIRASRGPAKCPVAGCKNKNVQLTQLKEDKDLERKVRRHAKRQHVIQQTQQDHSEMLELDDL